MPMGTKIYPIRLYRVHDMDLITLSVLHNFNIVKSLYCAITAFSLGKAFTIQVPPRSLNEIPQWNKTYLKHLSLDEEKDCKAIDIIERIADGNRSAFLKNLLRQYICQPFSEIYLANPADISFFNNAFAAIQQNKTIVDITHMKRRNCTIEETLNSVLIEESETITVPETEMISVSANHKQRYNVILDDSVALEESETEVDFTNNDLDEYSNSEGNAVDLYENTSDDDNIQPIYPAAPEMSDNERDELTKMLAALAV